MAAAAEQGSAASRLKITEIFFSIQGEAVFSGWPTVFVRLAPPPLMLAPPLSMPVFPSSMLVSPL
jgi:hypothetical protein